MVTIGRNSDAAMFMKHTVVGNILRAIGWLRIWTGKKQESPDKTFCCNVNVDASKKAGEVLKKKVLMDYLTGHIRSAWLLTGCYTACFSPLLLPSVSVWQLAHLIYLIGLVQSVGNVLKANYGDGGTSAGDS